MFDDDGYTDYYDCVPFGDAQAWEDEQVFQDREGDDHDWADGYDDSYDDGLED